MSGRHWLAAALAFWILFAIATDFLDAWAMHSFEAGILLTSAVWLAAAGVRGRPIRLHMLLAPLALIALWGPFQLLLQTTGYRFGTMREWPLWAAGGAVVFLGMQVLEPAEMRRRWLNGMLGIGACLAIVASLQMLASTGQAFFLFSTGYEDEILAGFVNRNHYAAFVILIFPLAVYGALQTPGRRLYYAAAGGVLFASVVASTSRSGLVLVAAELLLLLTWLGRRRLGGALAMLLSAGVATLAIGANALLGRFTTTTAWDLRSTLNLSTWQMLLERPWLGFGLGAWPEVYPQFATIDVGLRVNHAHNDWGEWAVDGGIIFLAAWLVIAFVSVCLARRRPWGLGVPAVLLHSLLDYPLRRPAVLAVAMVLLAAMASSRISRTRKSWDAPG